MAIPPEISELVEQLTNELNRIANNGLAIASQLLERFPNNTPIAIPIYG
jgi:hypothetical protein